MGPVMLNVMKSNSCHHNVASLWKGQEFGILGIATGYALGEDGLCRREILKFVTKIHGE